MQQFKKNCITAYGDLKRYNSVPVRDCLPLFAPTPYLRARAIRWYHLNLSHDDFCCHGN